MGSVTGISSSDIELTPAFTAALREIDEGNTHVFITGKAGTGKSTLLRYFSAQAARRPVILAPTGIAALNVGGQTIHRFFKFRPGVDLQSITRTTLAAHEVRLYRSLKQIVIDEVSMLRADLLDCMDAFLRRYGPLAEWPFGGVRLIMFGDLYQLPPVVTRADRELIYDHYQAPYFFAARALRGESLRIIELDKIFRQTDQQFIALLNGIRVNTVTADQLALLNSRCRPLAAQEDDPQRIAITATNAQAQRINARYLSRLSGPEYRIDAVIDGQFSAADYPAERQLVVKRGAKVIMLYNDPQRRWVNGSMATITDVTGGNDDWEVWVLIEASGERVPLERHAWSNMRYRFEQNEYTAEEVGMFTQFPVRLAWAITAHKSQGKTFSRVHIDLGHRAFAAGQTYVALSRCRTLRDLSLERAVTHDDVYVDRALVAFFEQRQAAHSDTLESVAGRKNADDIAALLAQSIATKRRLCIEYIHRNGHVGYRTIVARHISQKIYQNRPYQALEAYCTDSKRSCIFDTANILGADLLTP